MSVWVYICGVAIFASGPIIAVILGSRDTDDDKPKNRRRSPR